MAEEKSTVRKVAEKVKEAAITVAHAAEEHVVEPVGKALGIIKKKEAKPKSPKEERAEKRKIMVSVMKSHQKPVRTKATKTSKNEK